MDAEDEDTNDEDEDETKVELASRQTFTLITCCLLLLYLIKLNTRNDKIRFFCLLNIKSKIFNILIRCKYLKILA